MDLLEFGRRIRRAREEKGYSQEVFASMVGKDQTAISEYETGKRRMFVTDLPLFAEKLEVPLAYFFEGQITLDDLDRALINEFHQLPEYSRNHIVKILRTLVELFEEAG